MAYPFDYVQQGEQLCQEGRVADAVRAYKRAIRSYKREDDSDGVAFALGRLAECYETHDEVDKAAESYQRAIDWKTDIPAVYAGFASLLARRGQVDEAFHVADLWQEYGQRNLSGPAHQFFVELGSRWVREKRYDDAVALLRRAVQAIPLTEFPREHWEARG
jgi:tetratricopeptide (TPR) repeat protein